MGNIQDPICCPALPSTLCSMLCVSCFVSMPALPCPALLAFAAVMPTAIMTASASKTSPSLVSTLTPLHSSPPLMLPQPFLLTLSPLSSLSSFSSFRCDLVEADVGRVDVAIGVVAKLRLETLLPPKICPPSLSIAFAQGEKIRSGALPRSQRTSKSP